MSVSLWRWSEKCEGKPCCGTFYVVLKKGKIIAEGLFDYAEKQTGYYIYVKAKDKEHAVKIACDLVAEFKAREAGIG